MNRAWWTWLVVVAGAIVAASAAGTLGRVDLADVGVEKVTNVLVTLIFVALLIERAVEVFISPHTGIDKQRLKDLQDKLRTSAASLRAEIETARAAILAAPADATLQQHLVQLERQLGANLADDARHEAGIAADNRRTQRIALGISIPLSFVAALAGLRTLSAFLPTELRSAEGIVVAAGTSGASQVIVGVNEMQLGLFTAIDVVLTAGLLAGGADGIHQILDRFIKLASGKDGQKTAGGSTG